MFVAENLAMIWQWYERERHFDDHYGLVVLWNCWIRLMNVTKSLFFLRKGYSGYPFSRSWLGWW